MTAHILVTASNEIGARKRLKKLAQKSDIFKYFNSHSSFESGKPLPISPIHLDLRNCLQE